MTKSVFLVALCVMVGMVIAQKPPKKCMKQGTATWTECTANKMTQTFTSTAEGCAAIVKEFDCTYSHSKKAPKNKDCTRTVADDLTTCFSGTTFTRTFSQVGTECKTLKDPATLSCNKLYKAKKAKGGKKGKKAGKGKNNKNKRARGQCKYRRGAWTECDAVTNVRSMARTLKKQRPGCPPTLTIEKACRPSRKQQRGCKYKRGQWGECDGTTNIKTMVKTLKRGDPASCPPTQTKEKICKRKHAGLKDSCKYRKAGRWSECDPETGLISREMVLKKGDTTACLPKKTVTKSCNKKRGKPGKSGCKYDKSTWSPCDAATNKVTRTLTLVSGDPMQCNATKTQTKRCKNKHLRPHLCKYRRTSWGECDPGTNMREMVKTLKRGDPSKCDATQTTERKCRPSRNTNVCKYKNEPWSSCDPTTNLITRRQVLQSGPATCQPSKEYSRKCKKECRFLSGQWSECDLESEQMTRVDNLRPGSLENCPSTRVLNKPCGRKEKRCVYGDGEWSECGTSDQPVRTRTQQLVSGGPSCLPERVSTKSCTKNNGQDRCFYGPWQEYDECQNGVRKKIRTVIQGGLECERKSVKMKAC